MQVITKNYTSLSLAHSGYIAGANDGIVTIAGKPAARRIHLLNVQTLGVISTQVSLKNGHYAFFGLNLDDEYLIMVRDHKKEYEPFAWDYVKPADDLTIDEQQAMWASWQ